MSVPRYVTPNPNHSFTGARVEAETSEVIVARDGWLPEGVHAAVCDCSRTSALAVLRQDGGQT